MFSNAPQNILNEFYRHHRNTAGTSCDVAGMLCDEAGTQCDLAGTS